MNVFTRCALPLTLVLAMSGPALAQHGRPAMIYHVVSISANELQIFVASDEAEARDINNLGEIAGWATVPTGHKHAFKRTLAGATIDIGSAHPWHDTVAYGINDNSEVVGSHNDIGHDFPFYWAPIAGFLDLSRNHPDGYEARGVANAINIHGRIIGSLGLSQSYHAVTWWNRSADPVLVYQPPAGAVNGASDVSDSGWIAGTEADSASSRGYRARLGTLDYPPDPSSASNGSVTAVNEAGTVVGTTWYPLYGKRAIRYRLTGSPLILGLLPGGTDSEASDINEAGFIVGRSNMKVLADSEERPQRAFLFHLEFGMIALPLPAGHRSPLLSHCDAYALNDRKENGLIQVAGYCTRFGKRQAVRWDVIVGEHAQ